MSGTTLDQDSLRQLVSQAVLGPDFRRATFGGTPRGNGSCPWVRIVIRPVELHGQRHLQFSYFDAKKNITKNVQGPASAASLAELLEFGFAGIHVSTRTEEIDVRTTKKGKIQIGRRRVEPDEVEPQPHNRVKDVPLPEGQSNRLLQAMGIVTHDGRVRPTMRAKFTQINEFLKQLGHVLDEDWARSLGRELEILDCGCGSSYLTLAAHHYLNDVRSIPARILGVDVNEEVIRKSMARSEHLGAEQLRFVCERIAALEARPDIVLALHACDTASDEAIAQAIRSEAQLLLCVPCCHHHLNEQIRAEGPAGTLRPLLRHGILQQRTADLVTDAFRALTLRVMGYRTDVVEFVSPEHTSRNLMLRAIRGLPSGESSFVKEYLELRRFWGVTPYLEKVLGEPFQRLLGSDA